MTPVRSSVNENLPGVSTLIHLPFSHQRRGQEEGPIPVSQLSFLLSVSSKTLASKPRSRTSGGSVLMNPSANAGDMEHENL